MVQPIALLTFVTERITSGKPTLHLIQISDVIVTKAVYKILPDVLTQELPGLLQSILTNKYFPAQISVLAWGLYHPAQEWVNSYNMLFTFWIQIFCLFLGDSHCHKTTSAIPRLSSFMSWSCDFYKTICYTPHMRLRLSQFWWLVFLCSTYWSTKGTRVVVWVVLGRTGLRCNNDKKPTLQNALKTCYCAVLVLLS